MIFIEKMHFPFTPDKPHFSIYLSNTAPNQRKTVNKRKAKHKKARAESLALGVLISSK